MASIAEFKNYAKYLIQASKFKRLLKIPACSSIEACRYLENRGLSTIGFYYYQGDFNYRGKEYHLDSCIVCLLLTPEGKINGVWIRFINQKKFFIWLLDLNPEPQKYWLHPDLDLTKEVYVCEAIFDALSLGKLLMTTQVVACLGVTPSAELKDILNQVPKVILGLDSDTAGLKSTLGLLESNPKWWCIQHNYKVKDYNELLDLTDNFQYKTLSGIQAKIAIRSRI